MTTRLGYAEPDPGETCRYVANDGPWGDVTGEECGALAVAVAVRRWPCGCIERAAACREHEPGLALVMLGSAASGSCPN